jgi:hypothetical protein
MTNALNFSVSCWFESSYSPSDERDSIWEERIFLIKANSETTARAEAEAMARSQETSFENQFGQLVLWQFRHVGEVQHIDGEFAHGTELFSRHYKASEAKSLLTKFD